MDIIRRYALGKQTVQEIADFYECTKATVMRLARQAGLPKRPKCFPIKIKKATLTMLKQGKPLAEIKALLGVSHAYASKLGKENGLQRYGKHSD
jgi:hypothetical protein